MSSAVRGLWVRLRPDRGLLRDSALVSGGFGLARLLGFLFSVVTARALQPAEFGRMSYALTVAGIAGIFVTTAPTGLARFLARSAENQRARDAYFSNWLAIVTAVLGVSALAAIPYGAAMGVSPALVLGIVVNLAGVAVLEMCRELERGLNRFAVFSAYYVLANLIQLLAVVLIARAGLASAELFVVVYGSSSIAALGLLAATPPGVRLVLATVAMRRMRNVVRFIRPVLLQSVFWNLWFFSDVVLVQKLLGPAAVGNYAAAKAIANGFGILPSAIVYVLVPDVARLPIEEVGRRLQRALLLTLLMSAPIAAGVAVFAGPVVATLFGHRYPLAATPTVLLVVGMLVFGLKAVVGAIWLGLGHPVIETVSAGAAMVTTIVAGVLLVPAAGLDGAAIAFLLGAVAQLAVIGAITGWALAGEMPRIGQLSDTAILEKGYLDA